MSLYSIGSEEVKSPQMTEAEKEKVTFTYPPKKWTDAYYAQKLFFVKKNGIAFVSVTEHDVPVTSWDDAYRLYIKFWFPSLQQSFGEKISLKRYPRRVIVAMDSIENLLFGDGVNQLGFGHITDIMARKKRIMKFYSERDGSVKLKLSDFQNENFWKELGRIAFGLHFGKFKYPSTGDVAIKFLLDGAALPEIFTGAGKIIANVATEGLKAGAGAVGKGVGAFFSGLFSQFKTPIVIVGSGLFGWGAYKIIKSRSDKGRSLNPFSKSSKK